MRKFQFSGFIVLWVLFIAACGPSATTGETFKFQYTCIARTAKPCQLVESFYIPRVHELTNGQVDIEIASFPELGLAGPELLRLVEDGTLELGEIYSGYVGGDFPIIEVGNLWGLAPSNEAQLMVTEAINNDMVRIIRERTGGEPILRNFYSNQYIFSKEPLTNLEDFEGRKIRQHSTVLGDMLKGLGADGQFLAVAEVYTALERDVLDAAINNGRLGYELRWYDVTDYLVGPIVGSITVTYMTVNGKRWAELPPDLQQIMREVADEFEKENIRLLTEEWDPAGIADNVAQGMEYRDFTPEVKGALREIALEIILPNWVERVGGPDSEGAKIFNKKVAPIVGVKINPDGTASETVLSPGG